MSDIGKFLSTAKAIIKSVASIEHRSDKIDRDEKGNNNEGVIAEAMLGSINKKAAETVGLDTVNFETNKEKYKEFINGTKSELVHFVDDAEILADLMGALAESAPELDMAKIDKYNKEHPVLESDNVAETITTNTEDGYIGLDKESFNTLSEALGENADNVFNCMSNAIKSGSASRIANNQIAYQRDIDAASNILRAIHENIV